MAIVSTAPNPWTQHAHHHPGPKQPPQRKRCPDHRMVCRSANAVAVVALNCLLMGSSMALDSSLLGPGGWKRTWDVMFEVEDYPALVEMHCADVNYDMPCYYALAMAAEQDSVAISPNWGVNLHNYGSTYQRYLEKMLYRVRRQTRKHRQNSETSPLPLPPPKAAGDRTRLRHEVRSWSPNTNMESFCAGHRSVGGGAPSERAMCSIRQQLAGWSCAAWRSE